MPQAVLREPNGHSQQKPRGGISLAQAQVNGHQKRKLQDRRRSEIHGQQRLEGQRQNDYAEDGTGVVFMNLYVLVVWCLHFHFGRSVLSYQDSASQEPEMFRELAAEQQPAESRVPQAWAAAEEPQG